MSIIRVVRWSWSAKVITHVVDLLPPRGLFLLPTLFTQFTLAYCNKGSLTTLIHLCNPSNIDSDPIDLPPPHSLFFRRLTKLLETFFIFLKWSQTIDSIGHSNLEAALLRYGVPSSFTTINNGTLSQWKVLCQNQPGILFTSPLAEY